MRANIVYFICHDLGRHLACYGDETIPSPNLDAMAEQGVRFSSFFAASTPCSPARGCRMTGRYAHDQGLIGLVNRGWDYPAAPRSIVHDLNDAGYLTQLIGFQHESSNVDDLGYQGVWRESMRADAVADEAVRFLHGRVGSSQPFFLSIGTFEVHLPFDKAEYNPDDPDKVALPSFLPDNDITRGQMAMFHGSIRFMDEQFGRILAALAETSLHENTIVVFTTDHGMAFPRAKSTLYDAGIGVALIVRMPKAMGGRTGPCDELFSGIDLRPTLCELAGATIDPDVQGRSFAPLLTGKGRYRPREEIYSEKNFHDCFDPIRCVRTRRYKYIRSFRELANLPLPQDIERAFPAGSLRPDALEPRPAEELYHIDADPGEERNLVGSAEHADDLTELRTKLQAWMEATEDPVLSGQDPPSPPEQPL